jgi:hypothetical protein
MSQSVPYRVWHRDDNADALYLQSLTGSFLAKQRLGCSDEEVGFGHPRPNPILAMDGARSMSDLPK